MERKIENVEEKLRKCKREKLKKCKRRIDNVLKQYEKDSRKTTNVKLVQCN